MNNPTLQQLVKLPKWAQDHITLLEMRLREAKAELQEHLTAPPSEVAIERHAGIDDGLQRKVYLPKHSTILFFLDDEKNKPTYDRKHVEVRVMEDGPGDHYVSIATSGSGGYPSVQPQAANVFRVRLVKEP